MQGFNKLYLPLLVAALLVGCGDKKDEAASGGKTTQVAAKVNGTELTVHQINYALQRIPNLTKEQSHAASLQVARGLVDQELLVQRAMDEKLDRDPNVVQALDAARRQILAEAYMGRKLGAPTEPSDAEVKAYFDKHPELFSQRKVYRLQEISIKAPKDKQPEIRQQLAASKTLNDFGAWLKTQNYEAKVGQGVKPAEQLPLELLAKLATMPDGQAMMVNTPEGVLVLVLVDSQSQPVTFEQAKSAIARLLATQARQKAAKAELDALKAKAKIEYLGEFEEAGKEASATESKEAAAETASPAAATAAPATEADAISKGMSGLK